MQKYSNIKLYFVFIIVILGYRLKANEGLHRSSCQIITINQQVSFFSE